jgi:large subunit ribosomal protein L4
MAPLQAKVLDGTGKSTGNRELPEELFGGKINTAVMHQVVRAQLAAGRSGTASTKTRSEVRGGGKKPWRQKGTGRARHGSSRSPIWVGGGVVFGPHPRDYTQRVPKKMRKAALRSALADKAGDGRVWILDGYSGEKTKDAAACLKGAGLEGRVLLVLDPGEGASELVDRSFRNLRKTAFSLFRSLSTYDVLVADDVVFTSSAFEHYIKKDQVPANRVSDDDFVVEGKAAAEKREAAEAAAKENAAEEKEVAS